MAESAPNEGSRSDRHLRDALGDVGRAFFDFPSLSDVQRAAIPSIGEGKNMLVCAATAAGKTEAIFAPLVWRARRKSGNRLRGTQVLAVAPTRALVADLVARLKYPLARLGWHCGAQTSDFAGAESSPEVLITTPESLDSMLVRRFRRKSGSLAGHLLSQVSSVFVDEAHCFDSTARGDQLRFLLVRLRKLREFACEKGWSGDRALQICAASATVDQPQDLAVRLLGEGAIAITCAGRRPIDILKNNGCWLRLEQDISAPVLASHLPRATSGMAVGETLWAALQSGDCRKALVFVPSRRECDRMGKELRQYLNRQRSIWVDSHHGSLSRDHRLRAEQGFHENRDAVLVATNTLEVGVDIGNVDVVALVGAPPDTSSLLQRIGRGGRRTGLTRLLPLVRNDVEAAALGSQLVNAAAGSLEAKHRFHRWDVFPQQVISYIRQNQGQGRTRSSLVDLASQAWDQDDTGKIAAAHLEAWCNEGYLIEQRGRVHFGPGWQKFADEEESDYTIHSNIRASAVGVAVRIDLTGEIIGHVAASSEGGQTLTIGGRKHRVVRQDADIIVSPVMNENADEAEDTPEYRGRRRRISETFAAHVRRGCGLEATQAPLVKTANNTLWFHFGGEVYETALRELCPALCERSVIAGIALNVSPRLDAKALQSIGKAALERFVAREGLRLLEDQGLGRFADALPSIGIETLLTDLGINQKFSTWINTREICPLSPIEKWPTLANLLRG